MSKPDSPNPEDYFQWKRSDANMELLRELKNNPMSELHLHDQIEQMQALRDKPEAEEGDSE